MTAGSGDPGSTLVPGEMVVLAGRLAGAGPFDATEEGEKEPEADPGAVPRAADALVAGGEPTLDVVVDAGGPGTVTGSVGAEGALRASAGL
jgi:hypothetical protein